jgi:hypothetical protein
MKALAIMLIRRLYTAYAWLTFLEQDDAVAAQLLLLLCEHGYFPSRRTWERRLGRLPLSLTGLIGYGARHVVALLTPWATHGRAVAFESILLATGGGVWHQKNREQGLILPRSIDTEAGWSESGWPGWWYGWTWPLAVTAGAVWIPLAAELTVVNRGDNAVAPWLVRQLPEEVRDVLGDTQDNATDLRQQCHRRGCELMATRRGPYPHRDGGVEVRKVFHQLRSQAIEPCNGLHKNIFAWRVKMPVKGLQRSQRLVLGAVLVCQLVLLYQHEQHLPLGKDIKPLLRAA